MFSKRSWIHFLCSKVVHKWPFSPITWNSGSFPSIINRLSSGGYLVLARLRCYVVFSTSWPQVFAKSVCQNDWQCCHQSPAQRFLQLTCDIPVFFTSLVQTTALSKPPRSVGLSFSDRADTNENLSIVWRRIFLLSVREPAVLHCQIQVKRASKEKRAVWFLNSSRLRPDKDRFEQQMGRTERQEGEQRFTAW